MAQTRMKDESLVLYGAAVLAGSLVAYSALNGTRTKRANKSTSSWFPRVLRGKAKQVERALTINRSIVDVYSAWRAEKTSGLEVFEEVNNEHISWNGGEVLFRRAPGGRGTEVHLRVRGISANQALEDLRRFKMKLETGEVATTEGQPKGA